MGYIGEVLDVGRMQDCLRKEAGRAGLTIEEQTSGGAWPLLVLTRTADDASAPRILLSAGLHGDEPAGPLAILQLLQQGTFSGDFHWVIFPLLSPDNLAANRRENADGRDPNRDYREPQTPQVRSQLKYIKAHGGPAFDVAFLLHEDWESPGFYLYEQCRLDVSTLAPVIMQTAARYFPLHPSPVIEGLPARGGLISFRGTEPELDEWPESIYLMRQGSQRAYTLETPSSEPLQRRAECQAEIVTRSLEVLSMKP